MVIDFEPYRLALVDLCRTHRVRTLHVSCSAVNGTFDPAHSDMDMIVDFTPGHDTVSFKHYLGLKDELEHLFGRNIDLI